ncbi:diphthine--ammonia ligase [Halobacillus salinarum]|uniref:Diphthine--ammonia ligase n=1 Tax=Halobacillus salinarum TaxID=2932257 RepID=A0ABY4EKC5_9BACI|nr:diphthine--ammonia ligase [Halobacillus salinarum]UOQ44533.1 diphthine--ammonia ligase [Halobacillus salinarum]
MKKVIVSWSGGKDSALALHRLLNHPEYEVKGLLSTTSEASGRLPMHEVKRELIQEQAESLGLPLYEVKLPANADNSTYEQRLKEQFGHFKEQDIHTIVHADLFLEDIKAYRVKHLKKAGMEGIFPLWKEDTGKIANEFINEGFEAIVTSIDAYKLSEEFAGKLFNQDFLNTLPPGIDPCGENGEFHSFVFNGPPFKKKMAVRPGRRFETTSGSFLHVELEKINEY